MTCDVWIATFHLLFHRRDMHNPGILTGITVVVQVTTYGGEYREYLTGRPWTHHTTLIIAVIE